MRSSGAKAWEATVRKSQGVLKRRTRMSASHIDVDESCDDSDGGGGDSNSLKAETYLDEKVLSNGDFYTGEWSDSLPNGTGKYLWTDGCMYFGDWYRGKTMGKGRFCWPTGATYEGEFKNGYMDGNGIYIGSNGDTYRGCWASNVRHGQGTKHYTNGDFYEGEWRRGVQEGRGRYQWRNGNQYIGQWKNATISGNGTLIWANGNRYDGFWEDGLPKGNGTFRWADGRFYVGFWSKDPKQQKGTYYGDSSGSPLDWDPQEVYCVDLSECKICPTENLPFLSSQKPLEWSGLGSEPAPKQAMWRLSKVVDSCGKLRRSVEEKRILERAFEKLSMSESDGNVTSDFADEDGSVRSLELDNMDSIGTPGHNMKHHKGDTKRPGETISKGHKNYELMLNLQLGIRHAVGRPSPETPSLDLKPSAFDPKEKIWTRFPPEGSKHTPPHQSCEFKWKDYCPLVFRTLRMLFKVDAADYMLSICGDEALRELSSPGKSGSFFYLTNDDRYMIKTMKKNEVKTLLKMLSPYYNHVRAFEHTLVTKFFGLHCVKLGVNQRKVRFVIMGNLFCTEYAIHRRFDLKGSSHGRTTDKPEEEIDGNTTLKDLDLNYIFRLPGDWVQEFQRQVDRDCDFLELEGVMDYSLLVGIHFKDRAENTDQASEDGSSTPMGNGDESEPAEDTDEKDRTQESIRLGISMEARVEKTIRKNDCDSQSQIMVGEPTGEFHDVILFFGIIDILQDYDISKKLEHAYKAFQYDPTSISAVDPKQYSRRFRDFIYQVFEKDV